MLNNGVPPITLAMLRNTVFLPILIFLLIRENTRKLFYHTKNTWVLFILLGIFTVFIPNVAQNIGMQYTTASMSSIIQSSTPIFTIILALLFLGESRDKSKLVGSFIAMIGVVLLVSGGRFEFTGTIYGNILILISCISYAISGVILKKGLAETSPSHLLFFETLFGFLFLLILSVLYENVSVIFTFGLFTWFIIVVLAVFASGIASILYYVVLADTELSRLIVFVYLIPVFAVIFSYILLGEIITYKTVIFALLTLLGIIVAQRKQIFLVSKN